MAIRAVLFDVGGPIDTEVEYERLIDEHIRDALAARGIAVSDAEYAAANAWAIGAFAPNAYQAIIWHLAGHDIAVTERAYDTVAARGPERDAARGGIELRPGIEALLRDLHARGLRLGLAANQPASRVRLLDRLEIGELFTHREVEGRAWLPQARSPPLPPLPRRPRGRPGRGGDGRRPHRQRHRTGESARNERDPAPNGPARRAGAALSQRNTRHRSRQRRGSGCCARRADR